MPHTARAGGLRIDQLVPATGSTGTRPGLVAGLAGMNTDIKVYGISIRLRKDEQQAAVYKVAYETAEFVGSRAASLARV